MSRAVGKEISQRKNSQKLLGDFITQSILCGGMEIKATHIVPIKLLFGQNHVPIILIIRTDINQLYKS